MTAYQPHTLPADVRQLRGAIVGLDQKVPLLDGSLRQYINFDNAASTPAFSHVRDKVNAFLDWYSSVHRGSGFKSLVCTEAYERARAAVASFVGADDTYHCVIFVKNTTEAINKLANRMSFSPGDVVLTTLMEHHSNDLPWRPKARVDYIGVTDTGALDWDDLTRKLAHYRGRVRLVAVTGASNVTGAISPIYDIAELAHSYGSAIFVDCAQLAPHRAIHVGPPGSPRHLDFVALSAHKMYAPFGTGALIGPREFFEQGPPDYSGGGTIEIVTPAEVHWTEAPERDEAGSPNVVGAVALAASIEVLTSVGMDALAAHERDLTHYILRQLKGLDDITVYGDSDPDRLDDRLGVITFNVSGMPHAKVAAILSFEGGIGVRNGCFCAHPYVVRLLKVKDEVFDRYKARVLNHDRSDLPGMVRASFGCYNTIGEIDVLLEMLQRIVDGGYQGDYVVDGATGAYLPRGYDPAILERYFTL